MPVLAARDLNKSFGTRKLLDNASLSIEAGERVGLVGANGSGKSTLARIVAGVQAPDSGTVSFTRNSSRGYLAQELDFDPHTTARDIVLAGLSTWTDAKARYDQSAEQLERARGDLEQLLAEQTRAAADVERLGGWDVMHRVEAILGHVGIAQLDAKLGALSGGDRRRVALARVLVASPDFAIFDEPSNHLDVQTIEWLERYLTEEYKGALLLITHDRYLLDRLVDRTLEIDQGQLYSYEGGYGMYLEAKAERQALVARTEANRQNFLRRELEWLRRQPKARTGKQKARIQRAEAAVDTAPPQVERTARLSVDATRAGKTILELHHLTLRLGGTTLAQGLDLILNPGDRIGVVGRNGIGKTSLLRAILGELEPTDGRVVLGKNTRLAYFDQHRTDLQDDETVLQNVAGPRTHVSLGGRDVEIHAYLDRFLFTGVQQRQPVSSLSGGERARVALAKLLSRDANLVLLDEPTNDLDIAMLGALEELLTEDYPGCAMVVTHDRWFLNRVATSILAFEGDGRVVRYAGNYQAYRTQREAQDKQEAQTARRSEGPALRPVTPMGRSRGLTYGEQIELDGLMDRIEQAEQQVAELEAQLADPALYARRGHEVASIQRQLLEARDAAARLTARWEELESRKEQAAGKP
ncbi:MAG: ABC-F family ATP-binding cassette domain-containing protein [Polyangiaceae bacterium]|nr:ABC-F family ATP-binding cassette domain-containing protein [Polyangiaceae bacterium]